MEVGEYEPSRAIGMLTHDGPMEIRGRATVESVEPELIKLTITADIPGLDDSMQSPMTDAIRGSLRTIKELIEAET
jgi:hypothetical protein